MNFDELIMQRCLQLAEMGKGFVAPNPLVGSVLVHDNTIIGEGYHALYGQAHAEVNCLASVPPEKKHLIKESTLYVSLEPCAHWGKTPPCANLIIENAIPNVVIGCRDSYFEVAGKGIELLKNAGVNVKLGILEEACKELNKHFFTFHEKKRPYITLKWAETADGFVGRANERIIISNELSKRWVHQLRAEHQAILVGTQTIITDNPQLNNRYYFGNQPVRLVIDKQLVTKNTNIWDGSLPTVIFNNQVSEHYHNLALVKITDENYLESIINYCNKNKITSLFVEGGSKTLHFFLEAGLWDEIYTIKNPSINLKQGIVAPTLPKNLCYKKRHTLIDNQILHYQQY